MAMILDNQVTAPNLDVNQDPVPGAAAACQAASIHVMTTRFGALEVDPDLILTFPEGLIGFEGCTRYVVVRQDDNSVFRWLQSLDEPAVAFPIIEPGTFRPDYTPTIADADVRFLELGKETPALVFAVVSVPAHNPREMTANLLGPLVINPEARRGKQVIVQDEGYTTRHKVLDELLQRLTGSTTPSALAAAELPTRTAA